MCAIDAHVGQAIFRATTATGNQLFDLCKRAQGTYSQVWRFANRNEGLGRQSTAEELAYLNSGGKRFGQ